MSSILVISPIPIHPESAGNRARIAALVANLKALAHDVWFMHIEQEAGDSVAAQAYWGDRLIIVPYAKPRPRLRNFIRRQLNKVNIGRSYNVGIDAWYDSSADLALDNFFSQHPVDAVIVEYAFLSRALLRVPPGVRKFIDTHDVFSNRYQRYLDEGMAPTWFSCSPRQEAIALDRADAVIAIQNNEAEYFRRISTTPVVTIGHAIELQPRPAEQIVPGRILMVGSANQINVDGLNWFLNNVLPGVLKSHPHAELYIAGAVGGSIQPGHGYKTLGHVDDLHALYGEAQIVVNPMQMGTGLKIKSIEALSHARALVTTAAGAQGIEQYEHAFSLAQDAQQFTDEIIRLMSDPVACQSLAAAGFTAVQTINQEIRDTVAKLVDGNIE